MSIMTPGDCTWCERHQWYIGTMCEVVKHMITTMAKVAVEDANATLLQMVSLQV